MAVPTSESTSRGLRPKRSEHRPHSGAKTNWASEKEATSSPMVAGPASKRDAYKGRIGNTMPKPTRSRATVNQIVPNPSGSPGRPGRAGSRPRRTAERFDVTSSDVKSREVTGPCPANLSDMAALRRPGVAASAAPDDDARTDAVLAAAAATGSRPAFEALYRRHADAAWRTASAVASNPEDAADAVSDAFTRVLAALDAGRLNDGTRFRPYLLAAARNAAVDVHRRGGRSRATDRMEDYDIPATGATGTERVDQRQDASFVAHAFRSLPERWRSVLWLVEVERVPPREAAAILGLSANNVSQLVLRAKVGLRERFVQAHLTAPVAEACRFTVDHLGGYTVGSLSPRQVAKVDRHLAGCASCRARADELEDVGSSLRRVIVPMPLLLGPAAATKWQLTSGAAVAPTASAAVAPPAATGGAVRVTTESATLTSKAQRPLLAVSTGLFALGVISASVVGGPGTVRDRLGVPRQPVTESVAPPPQVVEDRIALSTSISTRDLLDAAAGRRFADAFQGGPSSGGGSGSGGGSAGGGSQTGGEAGGTAPPPAPPPEPLVNAGMGFQVGGVPAGASAGSGDGSCTGGRVATTTTGCPPPEASGTVVGVAVETDGSAGGGVLSGGGIAFFI